MKTIKIDGIIGWDVDADDIIRQLKYADGDVCFEINSPGGCIVEGFRIVYAIQTYQKGKTLGRAVSEASSMGSIILFSCDEVELYENSTVVLHNAQGCEWGDYLAMRKRADILEKYSEVARKIYVGSTSFSYEEVVKIMDEETWFIGEEDLLKLGKVIKVENPKDNDNVVLDIELRKEQLKSKMKMANEKILEMHRPQKDYEKVVALVGSNMKENPKMEVATPKIAAQSEVQSINERKDLVEMDLNELKAQHPAVYAQAVKEERERVTALLGFMDMMPEVVMSAVKDGSELSCTKVQEAYMHALRGEQTISKMEKENPPSVNPEEQELSGEEKTEAAEDAEVDKIVAQVNKYRGVN